jgi:hypothetical protein
MNRIRRLLGRSVPDSHARLIEDVNRTRLYMLATITDARRLDVPVPVAVAASVDVWRYWLDHLTRPE